MDKEKEKEKEKERESSEANGSPAANNTTTTNNNNSTPPKSSAKKSRGPPQSSVDTFAVQCNDCFKWRTLATEDQFEEYRSKQSEDPFVCNKLEGVVCDTPADIEYDSSRTWVMDKPNIPKTPKGFQRIIVLRRDYSKMDVQYVTPDGARVRAAPGIIAYLKEHPEFSDVSPSDFCFTSPKVMADTIPDHIEKKSPSAKKPKKTT